MNKTNKSETTLKTIPETVGEYIDEYILPNLADGKRTATQITEEIVDQARSRLEKSKKDVWFYYQEIYDLELIDSYCVLEQHKEIIQKFVQYAFDNWEGVPDAEN